MSCRIGSGPFRIVGQAGVDGDGQRTERSDQVVELADGGAAELEALDPLGQGREDGGAFEAGEAHADAGVHAVTEAELAGAVPR